MYDKHKMHTKTDKKTHQTTKKDRRTKLHTHTHTHTHTHKQPKRTQPHRDTNHTQP